MGPRAVLVVEDATLDPRFCGNPLVTGEPQIRFYAGATLTTYDGQNLGALCVIDTVARAQPSATDLASLRDLADIVVAQLELNVRHRQAHEREVLLELAEAVAGVAHWRFDLADGRVTWSDALYEICGVTRDSFELNYENVLGTYHPDDRPLLNAKVERAIKFGENYDVRLRIIRPDGALRHMTARAVCQVDEAGVVRALAGVFQDITEHVETRQRIEASEARYRLLAENATDLVTALDHRGRFTYVSPISTSMIGYPADQLLGQFALRFVHWDDRAALRAALARAGAGEPSAKLEYRLICADGRALWVESRPTLVRAPQSGEIVGVTDVIRDMTQNKANETALIVARRQAEAASASKGEFLSNMSHELRTPLTSILGFCKLLTLEPGLSTVAHKHLGRIAAGGAVLLATINDILDFSALDAHQLELQCEPTDAAALTEDMIGLLSTQARSKGLELSLAVDDALPTLVAIDPQRLRQLLLNLVGNAVRFTPSGSVQVRLSYTDGDRLQVQVIDTGIGVQPDRLDRLFQRFTQVDASPRRVHGGSGLGLAICKGLVELMGGDIGVESRFGEGSRFWFDVPAPPSTQAAALCPLSDRMALRSGHR